MDAKKRIHPDLAIFDSLDKNKPDKQIGWFAVPYFFVKDFMRLGKGIPASFWKFTFILWRELLEPEPVKDGQGNVHFERPYTCDTTVEWFGKEFGLDSEAVQDWSNAYSVSGLFNMTKGKRKVKDKDGSGTPTHWVYNRRAGYKDWVAFIVALANVVDPQDGNRIRRNGEVWSKEAKRILWVVRNGWCDELQCGPLSINAAKKKVRERFPGDGWPASDAFKLALALEVDKVRTQKSGQPGLPPVNVRKIQLWVEQGKAEATNEEDGSVSYTFLAPKTAGLKESEW